MQITWRRINNTLLGCIILVNAYIIAAPILPQVTYWWQAHHSTRRQQLTQAIHTPATSQPTSPNRLIIPTMLLDQATLEAPEGQWSNVLRHGVWRWPGSSTPDKGGNTVFLAHRFSYTGPHGAFYYLDKLRTGDEIGVIWNNATYTYRVVSKTEVPPTETSVQTNTSDARLTLFTCTPLWHPVNRLVIVAKLEDTP